MLPVLGIKPAIALSKVDLPAPLGPRILVQRPNEKEILIPRKTSVPASDAWTFSSRMAIFNVLIQQSLSFEKLNKQQPTFEVLDKSEMNSDEDDLADWDTTLMDGLEDL